MRPSDIFKKWKDIVNLANDKGIPLPMVRDPQTLEGSVSLTLVVMSSFLVLIGIVGKWSGALGGIDMNSAFNFFYASTTLYFGHTWISKEPAKNDKQNIDDPDSK